MGKLILGPCTEPEVATHGPQARPPRQYPMRLARHLAVNAEQLKEACLAKIPLPDEMPSAVEIFQSMTYGSSPEPWGCVDLGDIFTYLRGGKKLNLPPEWKPLIPRCFPMPEDSSATT